jgi:hypothetical protein
MLLNAHQHIVFQLGNLSMNLRNPRRVPALSSCLIAALKYYRNMTKGFLFSAAHFLKNLFTL